MTTEGFTARTGHEAPGQLRDDRARQVAQAWESLLQIRRLVQSDHPDLPALWERAQPLRAVALAIEAAGVLGQAGWDALLYRSGRSRFLSWSSREGPEQPQLQRKSRGVAGSAGRTLLAAIDRFDEGVHPVHTPGGVSFAPQTPTMYQRWIRAMRADPPGAAGQNKARKETFCAALEQAEQLFAAAKVTDAMVRPLLVYYGLNQAGRAIAAAASHVHHRVQQPGKPGEPWKLTGHGLQIVGGTNAMNGLDVAAIPLMDHQSGAFPQLAEILGCGSLIATKSDGTNAAQVTVGQIWATMPDTVGFSLPGDAGLPVLAFGAEGPLGNFPGNDLHSLLNAPLRRGQESARLEGIPRRVHDAVDQKTALKEFLDRYPTLDDYQLDGPDGRLDWLPDSAMGFPEVRLFWNLAQPTAGQPAQRLEDKVATLYRGQHFVFPALGDNPAPLHPLLAWWAVLYALSMLARYEPCAWNKRANIDNSKEAVAIEHLLEAALEYLPRVILDTIDQVS